MRLHSAALVALTLVAACGSSNGSGSPPTVVSTSPANGATGVAVTAVSKVTFTEAMDCSTLVATFGEPLSGVGVAGGVICNGTSATFAPSVQLEPNAMYVAAVQAGVKDANGNGLAADRRLDLPW
jgi:hypothetical protein